MKKRWLQICTFAIMSLLILMGAGNAMAQTDPMAGMNMTTPTPAATDPNSLDLQIAGSSTGTSSQTMMMDTMEMANMMQQQKTAMDSMMNMMNMGMNMGSTMMNQMMSMDSMMMNNGMNMGGTMSGSGMNNGMSMGSTTSGSGGLDLNILAQLQATNTQLTQMLNLLLTQTKDANFQLQLQTIQQMLINQAALLQLLSKGSMNMGATGNSGSMNMGANSGGMSGMMMM